MACRYSSWKTRRLRRTTASWERFARLRSALPPARSRCCGLAPQTALPSGFGLSASVTQQIQAELITNWSLCALNSRATTCGYGWVRTLLCWFALNLRRAEYACLCLESVLCQVAWERLLNHRSQDILTHSEIPFCVKSMDWRIAQDKQKKLECMLLYTLTSPLEHTCKTRVVTCKN